MIEDSDGKSDYEKYRGKCKKICTEMAEKDPTLTIVKGWYYCPFWGKQAHYWLVKDGKIIDPTARQFPSKGIGEYVPYDGNVECAECGKTLKEEDAILESHYAFCSGTCYRRFVGV